MNKLFYTIFSTILFFPFSSAANEIYSVEIEALTLVMEQYNSESLDKNALKDEKPSYMAFKQDECNAKVEVTEKTGIQLTTTKSFDVNVCKKEIFKIVN